MTAHVRVGHTTRHMVRPGVQQALSGAPSSVTRTPSPTLPPSTPARTAPFTWQTAHPPLRLTPGPLPLRPHGRGGGRHAPQRAGAAGGGEGRGLLGDTRHVVQSQVQSPESGP